MQHEIPVDKIGPHGEPMSRAVEACVHCGFCLPTCPTYAVLGEEMDSPRGRIYLMRDLLEGKLEANGAAVYLDRCLGCLGCVTVCPSGVSFGELITPFRMKAEAERKRSVSDRLLRQLVLRTVPHPGRFRMMATLGRLAKPLRGLVPGRLREMVDLLPDRLPKSQPLPEVHPAEGERRARVAMLAGCAQQVLAPEINWATLRVLARNGVEVVIPKGQGCCGALAAHTGAGNEAKACARRNIEAFPNDVDAVVTNAAGCGSGMHEYPLWLKGEAEESAAEAFAVKVKDVSVVLSELGLEPPGELAQPLSVAYHDSCHLAHAQRVTSEPRRLLATISNLKLLEVPDGEICCGSAGTYNIEQPQIAGELGERKANAILSTGAQAVVAGNIGCMVQIEAHLRRERRPLPVYHTMQLLDMAYRSADAT
ncbi:MAG: glycolate oxidase subunit GlcF [Pirellulaceae bacterium]|nr:glycolate oxidase subunit GlcF [Pirellulaceae bacterium]